MPGLRLRTGFRARHLLRIWQTFYVAVKFSLQYFWGAYFY